MYIFTKWLPYSDNWVFVLSKKLLEFQTFQMMLEESNGPNENVICKVPGGKEKPGGFAKFYLDMFVLYFKKMIEISIGCTNLS